MSYVLIPPGRRGNKVWYVRISVAGRRWEISTHTRDKGMARRFAERAERSRYEHHYLERSTLTARQAISGYLAWRRPSKQDRNWLDRLEAYFDRTPISEIGQAELDLAARSLYPGRSPATWNRQVYTPMLAVLRHAGMAPSIRRPREPKPRHRAITRAQADVLIATAGPELSALLTFLFFTGARLSEALNLTWGRVDLQGGRVHLPVGKTDEDIWSPLHPRAVAVLASLPRRKHVFRWRAKSSVARLVRELSKTTGIPFTCHMARHSFATWLVDAGVNLRDVMAAGRWRNYKSVLRYAADDADRVKKAVESL